MSTTALAIATMNQAQANLAQAEASRARTLVCKNMMQTFESKSATVDLRQEYASCVHRLYPEQDHSSYIAGGLAISLVVMLVLFIVYWAKEDLPMGVCAAILGFMGTWAVIAAVVGAVWAFRVLF